jgi:hypothetical protein
MERIGERSRDALDHAELERAAAERTNDPPPRATTTSSPEARMAQAIARAPLPAVDYSAMFAQLRPPAGAVPSPVAVPPAAAGMLLAGGRTPSTVAPQATAMDRPTLGSARDAAIQQRLDAFRARFSGPYHVDGQTVEAPPMFRMNIPANNTNVRKTHAELSAICKRAGFPSDADMCISGRCSPEQLVRVTQALLDAGKLPPPDAEHPTLASRIRAMQWSYGIGVDCAGYTQQAAAYAHGSTGKAFENGLMGDIFSGMQHDPRFTSVKPEDIRAGDVIHLKNLTPPRRGEAPPVGHNVIVHGHTMLSDAKKRELQANEPNVRGFLQQPGTFDVFEVDSSWGAGDGKDYGGYRRDTWIYNRTSGQWASYSVETPRRLYLQPVGPQGEKFDGAYRPRAAS